jgi:hypothetical protein
MRIHRGVDDVSICGGSPEPVNCDGVTIDPPDTRDRLAVDNLRREPPALPLRR